jgi:1-deoxy-D-xylulose-5-phosphate reductoisomerase
MSKKKIIILGASGSIGRQTLEAIRAFPESFELAGAQVHRDAGALEEIAREFPRARLALSAEDASPSGVCGRVDTEALRGKAGLVELISGTEAELVVNGIAGSAGLEPSLIALASGKDLALANKESVVMGWALLEAAAAASGRSVIPVDSEHAALFQLINRVGRPEVEEITITASGGAFRDKPLAELALATPAQAATHPNWKMGRKISIDSASLANKGLEVIEASRLFGFPSERIKVLIHPESLVHALVRARDGSLYANMSAPDMRLPILNALSYPEVLPSSFGRLELGGHSLEFREPDPRRYPLLGLAYNALADGYGATVAYNAADEVAVAAFEAGEIGFLDIAMVVEKTLGENWPRGLPSLEAVFEADGRGRRAARAAVKECR